MEFRKGWILPLGAIHLLYLPARLRWCVIVIGEYLQKAVSTSTDYLQVFICSKKSLPSFIVALLGCLAQLTHALCDTDSCPLQYLDWIKASITVDREIFTVTNKTCCNLVTLIHMHCEEDVLGGFSCPDTTLSQGKTVWWTKSNCDWYRLT